MDFKPSLTDIDGVTASLSDPQVYAAELPAPGRSQLDHLWLACRRWRTVCTVSPGHAECAAEVVSALWTARTTRGGYTAAQVASFPNLNHRAAGLL